MITEALEIFNRFMAPLGKVEVPSKKLFYFNNGDVDRKEFPLPHCLEAEIQFTLNSRMYGYSNPQGDYIARKKIAQYESAIVDGRRISEKNVCLTSGVTNALSIVFERLKFNGLTGEVIIPTPSYPIGEALALKHGFSVKKVSTKKENGFLPTAEELSDVINYNSKAVLLTSPNNPTGTDFLQHSMESIYALCQDKDLYLIIDEIFAGLMLNGNRHPQPRYDIEDSKIIRIKGWSKDRGTAGFRIGYAVAPSSFSSGLADVINLNYGNAPTLFNRFICKDMIMRRFMIHPEQVPENVIEEFRDYRAVIIGNTKKYEANYSLIKEILSETPRVMDMTETQAGFCFFVRFGGVNNDFDFAKGLYTKTGVILVPGTAFNATEMGWMRLTFSVSPQNLEQGLYAIKDYLKR